jgi:hypothetical protein
MEQEMTHLNLFDEIASIGSKFLESTDRGHKVLSDYAWQLASICDLIKHTHSIVNNKLEAIDKADTLEDATNIAGELSRESLSASFRASGLCDVFLGYGKSLRRITEKYQNSPDPENAPPITPDEQHRWILFCDSLEERELQVAGLYVHQIQGLRDLVFGSPSQDLKQIKEHAQQAKAILTDQLADFDALAANFRKRIKV